MFKKERTPKYNCSPTKEVLASGNEQESKLSRKKFLFWGIGGVGCGLALSEIAGWFLKNEKKLSPAEQFAQQEKIAGKRILDAYQGPLGDIPQTTEKEFTNFFTKITSYVSLDSMDKSSVCIDIRSLKKHIETITLFGENGKNSAIYKYLEKLAENPDYKENLGNIFPVKHFQLIETGKNIKSIQKIAVYTGGLGSNIDNLNSVEAVNFIKYKDAMTGGIYDSVLYFPNAIEALLVKEYNDALGLANTDITSFFVLQALTEGLMNQYLYYVENSSQKNLNISFLSGSMTTRLAGKITSIIKNLSSIKLSRRIALEKITTLGPIFDYLSLIAEDGDLHPLFEKITRIQDLDQRRKAMDFFRLMNKGDVDASIELNAYGAEYDPMHVIGKDENGNNVVNPFEWIGKLSRHFQNTVSTSDHVEGMKKISTSALTIR